MVNDTVAFVHLKISKCVDMNALGVLLNNFRPQNYIWKTKLIWGPFKYKYTLNSSNKVL